MKLLEDLGDMFDMILFIQGENKNIIQIDDNKNIQKIGKNGVKKSLKARRCIGKSEWHNKPLKGTIASTKSSLPFITRSNLNEMVSMLKINLGKNLALDGAANRSETSGSGYLSFLVMALSHRKSTHNWREPSFFLTKRTGAPNGELEG